MQCATCDKPMRGLVIDGSGWIRSRIVYKCPQCGAEVPWRRSVWYDHIGWVYLVGALILALLSWHGYLPTNGDGCVAVSYGRGGMDLYCD
jgi:hypothetical protein